MPTSQTTPLRDKRIYVNRDTMQVIYKRLVEEGTTFIDSVSSLYVPSLKVKYVDTDTTELWPDLLGEFIPMTPGEMARTELERYCGKPNVWYKKESLSLLEIPPPNYFDGNRREGKLWYVDLQGAYHQIYSELTLDCAWPRGVGQLLLRGVGERLRDKKTARNAVVGISRNRHITMFYQGGFVEKPFYNPWFNPGLWRHIQSILHEIACFAVERKCCYVATDGYIFTDPFNFGYFLQYLDDIGFKYKTLNGKGYIHGWADYKVGSKETKFKRDSCNSLDNLVKGEDTVRWFKRIKSINQKQSTTVV